MVCSLRKRLIVFQKHLVVFWKRLIVFWKRLGVFGKRLGVFRKRFNLVIVDDIYNNRCSAGDNHKNPFDE